MLVSINFLLSLQYSYKRFLSIIIHISSPKLLIMRSLLILLLSSLCVFSAIADEKLSGTIIGTELSVNYETSSSSTVVNTKADAFDGNPNTYFASYERSYTWLGLDLGEPHIITRVGCMPRNFAYGPGRLMLGIFEGANREDFMDAVPLYMVTSNCPVLQMFYADVQVSKGFRYVRYVGPNDARCTIAELEFYGHPGEGDDSQFYRLTNLPTVTIHTLDGVIPEDKVTQIVAQLTILGDDGHAEILTGPGTIRERGNASRLFPKRPYRIKFDSKQNVLGSPAKAKKWTLIPNYSDKTLVRNMLAFEISRRLEMAYTPFSTLVDVMLNGEYKGCYQLNDQVEVNKNRVNIVEMSPEDNSGEALTGGYLFEIDAYAEGEASYFISNSGNPVTIKSPDDEDITTAQYNYIKNHFNLMEQNKKQYLDINSFLRHFLVGELSGNTDTYWSTYMYKNRSNDTIFTGPVWDFDIAFNNDQRTYPINNLNDFIYRTKGSNAGNMRNFVDQLIVYDPEINQQLKETWRHARHKGLTAGNIIAYLDSLETLLQQAQTLNFTRWDIMNTLVQQNPVIWGSYEAEVQNVRSFIAERFQWMDNKLGNTSGDYALLGDVNDDEHIDINDIVMMIDYLLGADNDIYLDAADIDKNGDISILDLTALIDCVLRK